MSFREYVFQCTEDGNMRRIPHARWDRVREGDESIEEYANQSIYIAYAYISTENGKPDYCLRIDGAIYYFDNTGRVILDKPQYFDLLQDLVEASGGVINLQHRKKKKQAFDKYYWELNSQQIQAVIDYIW